MFITVDPSRIADIKIRPGDRVRVNLPEFKAPAYLDVTEVTPEGVYGTLDINANSLLKRFYGWSFLSGESHVYFATWDQVDSVYMRG